MPNSKSDRQSKLESQGLSQHLSQIVESISDAFLAVDDEWCIIYVNSQAKQLFNGEFEPLLGKSLWEGFPSILGSAFQESLYWAAREQVTVNFDTFYPPHDRWYAGRAAPFGSGLAIYFQDVTERKAAELNFTAYQLNAKNRLAEIEAIYATAPIGLCFVDPQLRFVRINERLAEINGIPARDHIGKTLRELLPEMADELEPLYQQVVETGVPIEQLEISGVNPAQPGVNRDWLLSLYPLKDDSERLLGINVMVNEITGYKSAAASLVQANGILRAVVDGTKDVIYVKDLQGRYVLANSTAAEWLGRDVETILGQDDMALFPLPKAQEIQQIDRQVMETGETTTYEEEVPTTDGAYRSVLSTKYSWRDEAGNICGMIGITQDVSDRKQAELERERLLRQEKQAREQAEKANRIKDEFLAVLSHELRSPLNPILGWAKILQKGKLDEAKTQEALNSIERNAKLQSQLIEDLLDISRILQGKLLLSVAPVDLATVTQAAMETVRLAAENKGIQIQTFFEPSLGQVSGDSGRLQQIVWNLLSNAVKFTPSGGRVEVHLSQVGDTAQLRVSDTGKGINTDFLPYVFEHFRQEDGATTRKFGGLGLGLAIVRQLIELHGGSVLVESPGQDQGATFTIRLPLLRSDAESQEETLLPSLSVSEPTPLEGIKVLVVDDEMDSRDFVTFVLEQAGAEIVAVPSASQALQFLQSNSPQLLVSDIGMSDMDGYSLIRIIRQQLPQFCHLPAIALTAYAGEANEQQVLQAGFHKHLAKPIDPDELVEAVTQLLK